MKRVLTISLINLFSAVIVALLATPAAVSAATGSGTASMHVSPSAGSHSINSTFTITVSETSSTSVAAVESDMSYPASQLQCLDIDASTSAFATSYQNVCSGGTISVARGVQGATVTGTQTVADITFKVIGGSGSAQLTMAGSSEIDDTNVNNVCDNTCAGGSIAASFSLTTPTPQPASPTVPSNTISSVSRQTTPKSSTTSQQTQKPAAPVSQTLADTTKKATLSTDKSAAELPGMNWANVVAAITLLIALALLAAAAARWLAAHRIRITVTSKPKTTSNKHSVKKQTRKPAKRPKQ